MGMQIIHRIRGLYLEYTKTYYNSLIQRWLKNGKRLKEWEDKLHWEKIFARKITEKWLVSKTYKELLKLKNEKAHTF